jgi:hypothetical protein
MVTCAKITSVTSRQIVLPSIHIVLLMCSLEYTSNDWSVIYTCECLTKAFIVKCQEPTVINTCNVNYVRTNVLYKMKLVLRIMCKSSFTMNCRYRLRHFKMWRSSGRMRSENEPKILCVHWTHEFITNWVCPPYMVVTLRAIRRPIERKVYETYVKCRTNEEECNKTTGSQATSLWVVHYSQRSVSAVICVQYNLDYRRSKLDKCKKLWRLGEFHLAVLWTLLIIHAFGRYHDITDQLHRSSNNEDMLHEVREERNSSHIITRKKANCIGQILRRNCVLEYNIEENIEKTRKET